MYTIRTIPPDQSADAQGLTLQEAFTRIMALMGIDYSFTRTGREMHLLMAPAAPDAPTFVSAISVDQFARTAIMAQVCCHGFGRFQVLSDEQYRIELLSNERAA